MIEQLNKLYSMLLDIDDKLNELERINSMVIVTCDACENGNDIKYDVANVMVIIQEQLDSVGDDIRSNISECDAVLKSMESTLVKGDYQNERITSI